MNGEWVYFELARWILSLVLVYLGYHLGISQKIQALREYITGVVKDEYPSLFFEIKGNSERLDNYPERPDVDFDSRQLDHIYNRGLEEFMKRHHKDLFLLVDSYRKKILPKINKLDNLRIEKKQKMFNIWSNYLKKSLPREAVDANETIAELLLKTINPYYVLPSLLNQREDEVRNKIEACIRDRTYQIYRETAESQLAYVIRRQYEIINFDEISQSLIEKAKPEIANLIEAYNEMKKQNDTEVKGKLLPLLQKYISNPI